MKTRCNSSSTENIQHVEVQFYKSYREDVMEYTFYFTTPLGQLYCIEVQEFPGCIDSTMVFYKYQENTNQDSEMIVKVPILLGLTEEQMFQASLVWDFPDSMELIYALQQMYIDCTDGTLPENFVEEIWL